MASVVDICNLALSRLGDEATVASINPPEGSPQAEHCARWFPVTRDKALATFPWSFATRTVRLARLADEPIGYQYAYAVPEDDLRIVEVFDEHRRQDTVPFRVERGDQGRVLLSDCNSVCVRYISRQTNTAVFSPSFVDALAWLLASDLAGPMLTGTSGVTVATKCYEAFMAVVEKAKAEDGSQECLDLKIKPSMQGDYCG